MSHSIEVAGVSLAFPMLQHRPRGIKELFVGKRAEAESKEYQALDDVSFKVARGEVLGLIGANGSGKSTLLKVISGIYKPDRGKVITRGRISALLELGSGFREELTGFENIALNGALLGLSPGDITKRTDGIVEFSGLSRFIHQPLRTYSSGMRVRLGFAIAAAIDPEILLIDEVLAVGDEDFSRKSLARLEEMASGNTSVVVVSHNLPLMAKFCHRLILLSKGKLVADGSSASVVHRYYQQIGVSDTPVTIEGAVRLLEFRLTDASGAPISEVIAGAAAALELEREALEDIEHTLEVHLNLSFNQYTASDWRSGPLDRPLKRRGDRLKLRYQFDALDLVHVTFHALPSLATHDRKVHYDFRAQALPVKITPSPMTQDVYGIWAPRGRWIEMTEAKG